MATCTYCERTIVWKHAGGRWTPMNPNGTEHARECRAASLKVEAYAEHVANLERIKQLSRRAALK